VLGGQLNLPAEKQTEASVLIEANAANLLSGNTQIEVGLFSRDRKISTVETVFVGPRR
jgi:hypothetical protein